MTFPLQERRRGPRLLGFVASMALVATACGSDGQDIARMSRPVTPTAVEEPAETFPLTGEATDDPRAQQPVIAVKIDNSPAARPQAGLDAADIVYEQVVEGGITRLVALFHSELPTEVGPVRSARLVDVAILDSWHPILVYSGARGDVTSVLAAADNIGLFPDAGRPVYWREQGRPGSHDLMADLQAALVEGADLDDAGPAPTLFPFAAEPPAGGSDGEAIEIRMSGSVQTSWQYDDEEGVYRRSQGGNPTLVTGDGTIGAANVIVVLTDIGPGGCCDTSGSRFSATRLQGDGDAVVLRDGQWYDVTWSKGDVNRPLRLMTRDGAAFPLRAGPSWIHLAPIDAADRPVATSSEDDAE